MTNESISSQKPNEIIVTLRPSAWLYTRQSLSYLVVLFVPALVAMAAISQGEMPPNWVWGAYVIFLLLGSLTLELVFNRSRQTLPPRFEYVPYAARYAIVASLITGTLSVLGTQAGLPITPMAAIVIGVAGYLMARYYRLLTNRPWFFEDFYGVLPPPSERKVDVWRDIFSSARPLGPHRGGYAFYLLMAGAFVFMIGIGMIVGVNSL